MHKSRNMSLFGVLDYFCAHCPTVSWAVGCSALRPNTYLMGKVRDPLFFLYQCQKFPQKFVLYKNAIEFQIEI